MKNKIILLVTNLVILLLLSSQTYALSNSISETASGGSTYTLSVIVDYIEVDVDSDYSVMIKLTVNSFGTDISDFHDIVLYAKIEGGTFIKTDHSAASLITSVSGETQAVFNFKLENIPTNELSVFGKAYFRENKSWDIDPETTTMWFDAFSITVETESITVETESTTVETESTTVETDSLSISLTILSISAISLSLRKRKK